MQTDIATVTGQSLQRGYLSLRHAAVWADVSPKTLQRWIATGLPVYQASEGGKVLVKPSDIDHFLKRREVPQVDVEAMVNETLREMEMKGGSKASGKALQRQPSP
jgi:hypothetical protein